MSSNDEFAAKSTQLLPQVSPTSEDENLGVVDLHSNNEEVCKQGISSAIATDRTCSPIRVSEQAHVKMHQKSVKINEEMASASNAMSTDTFKHGFISNMGGILSLANHDANIPFVNNVQMIPQFLQESSTTSTPCATQQQSQKIPFQIQQRHGALQTQRQFHQMYPQFQFLNTHDSERGKLDSILSLAPFMTSGESNISNISTTSHNNIQTATSKMMNGNTLNNTSSSNDHIFESSQPRKRPKLSEDQLSVSPVPQNSKNEIIAAATAKTKTQGRKKVERDAQWMIQYHALKAYHEENGHANVPMHYASNKRLGHWINNQRQLYRKHKAGLPSSMTEKRIQLLEDLDFAWVLGKDWKHKRCKMKKDMSLEEKDEIGTGEDSKIKNLDLNSTTGSHKNSDQCSPSADEQVASTLFSSVQPSNSNFPSNIPFRKRHNFLEMQTMSLATPSSQPAPTQLPPNSLSCQGNHNDMNQNRSISPTNISKQLNNIDDNNLRSQSRCNSKVTRNENICGADVSPPPVVSTVSSSFSSDTPFTNERSKEETETTIMKSGNLNKVSGDKTNCNNRDGQGTAMIKRPQNVVKSSNLQTMKSSDLQWQKHLKNLIEFKAMYGHCNVPFQYLENKSLGYWVHNQRQVYKKWLKGEPCSLTKSRIESLQKLGFSLKSQRALKKEKMAASMAGIDVSSGKKLAQSLASNFSPKDLRGKSQAKAKKKSIHSLNPQCGGTEINSISLLPKSLNTSTGKSINMRKVKIDAFDVLWNRRLAELRDFHLSNNHSDVPSNYPTNKPLGIWAMNQRQQYRKLQMGDKSSLTPQRIAALETLNFRWSLGKGMRGKDSSTKITKRKSNEKKNSEKRVVKKSSKNERDSFGDVLTNISFFSTLTDDLICIVLSFLPSIRSVVSYCLTSKRGSKILNSIHMEQLCKSLYVSKFGVEGIRESDEQSSPCFWRNAWHNIYSFRRGLKTQAILDEIVIENKKSCEHQRKSLGILTPAEEDQAIFYDNPSSAPSSSAQYCLGYFGMLKFGVQISSCPKSDVKEVIAVWGDFSGLRVIDESPMNMLENNKKLSYQSIGETEFGQILTVITTPTILTDQYPCIFLGSASGAVLSVCAKFCHNTMSLKYNISSVSFAHTNELTALSWFPASRTNNVCNVHLISGGCDGKVYLYPNALSLDDSFDLDERILCCKSSNDAPILSLACCKIQSQHKSLQLLITGDGDGNITLWESAILYPSLAKPSHMTGPRFTPVRMYKSSDYCRITNLKVIRDKFLVSGDTSGNVRVWDILNEHKNMRQGTSKSIIEQSPNLSILFKIPAAHGGTIEEIDVIGNVLLTTGGSDGFIRGWDLNQGDLIGSVSCHKGISKMCLPQTLKSSVVGLFCTGCQNLISLCRDGSLHIWDYGKVSEKKIEFKIRKLSWDLTTSEIEGGVIPAAAVLSNLGGKTTSSLLIPHSNPPANVLGLQDLKKIMTCYGNHQPTESQKKLRDCMRLSIIKAAYEHASNPDWSKFPETPFIGCDGKVYRYIKKAFATFSGMRPCRLCRGDKKGAYHCRLKLKHDSSDVDDPGHNSLNTLRSAMSQSALEPNIFQCYNSDKMSGEENVENKNDDTSVVIEASNDSWNCHKCQKKNSAKNKRCPVCSSWKGGKRKMINVKKSKKEKKTCSFCQFSNELGTEAKCGMCHETINVKENKEEEETNKETEQFESVQGVDNLTSSETFPVYNSQMKWECHKCSRMNSAKSKRCKCNAWRGGRRQVAFKRSKSEEGSEINMI